MKSNLRKLLLRQSECIAGIGEKDIASVFIECHIGMFTTLEVCELFGIIAFDPAGFMY